MRGLICILMAMTMLVSACGKQPKLPWQKSQPKFAVVDWQKLMKDHPKYKELIVSGESVENVMRMRDRQLQMGQQQLNLLSRMKTFKAQGKQKFQRAEFAAKMAEQEAIENDRFKKLQQAAGEEVEGQVAKDRANVEESFRLPILNLRMKLQSVKMTKTARAEVLKELDEVMKAKQDALAGVENKKQQLINEKLSGEYKAAQDRLNAFAKQLGETGPGGSSVAEVDGKKVDVKEGSDELDKLIESMDKQIRIKQETHDKILDNINSDIESAIKKVNLQKKYVLVLRDVRTNISATDITDEVSAEVKKIAN